MACGSQDPYGQNIVVPEGSIYVEPAMEVEKLGYTITHVDTIIGFIDAYHLRGGPGSEAERLVVDVFTAPGTGRRVVSIAAQSLQRVRFVTGFRRISGQPVTPSHAVRRDAAALLRALGCEDLETEQRMGADGIEFQAWCANNGRTQGSP